MRQEVEFHPVLKPMAEDPVMGPAAQKHIQQQASLVGNMKRLGLLAHNHCYIEFGAGRGNMWFCICNLYQLKSIFFLFMQLTIFIKINVLMPGGLSHWVQLSIKDEPGTEFILIDKSSCRYKVGLHHFYLSNWIIFIYTVINAYYN